MKMLVETKGPFQLMDNQVGVLIRHDRPTVTSPSNFLSDRVSRDQVRVIAELGDGATDEEWVKYLAESEGNLDLAVESFKSAFSGYAEDETETEGEAKPRRGRAKKAE